WPADGFHRVEAARHANLTEIDADVREGTQRDALLFAVGANATHGLRRTNADKRRAVCLLLRDSEWGQWSDGEIARRCGVSDKFVGKVRHELSPNGSEMRKATRNGRTYDIDTAATGERAEPPGEEILEQPPRPQRKFGTVVIAPQSLELTERELLALPLRDLAAPDAVLWLWATNERLPTALEAAKAWG